MQLVRTLFLGVWEENKQRYSVSLGKASCVLFSSECDDSTWGELFNHFLTALTISPSPRQIEALIVTRNCQMEIR